MSLRYEEWHKSWLGLGGRPAASSPSSAPVNNPQLTQVATTTTTTTAVNNSHITNNSTAWSYTDTAVSRPHASTTVQQERASCRPPAISSNTFSFVSPPTSNGIIYQVRADSSSGTPYNEDRDGDRLRQCYRAGPSYQAPLLGSQDLATSKKQQGVLPGDKVVDSLRYATDISSSFPSYNGVRLDQQGYYETQPIYGNATLSTESTFSSDGAAYSEGSITPTNAERSNSPCPDVYGTTGLDIERNTVSFQSAQPTHKSFVVEPTPTLKAAFKMPPAPPVRRPSTSSLYAKECQIYGSSGTLSRSSGRPPPLPPARRTSSISNLNAVTMGTLRNAGCSTYEEFRTLRRSSSRNSSFECQPIYANSASDCMYSDTGSIISSASSKKNADRRSTPSHVLYGSATMGHNQPSKTTTYSPLPPTSAPTLKPLAMTLPDRLAAYQKETQMYLSTGTLSRSGRPPPLPPPRRTSSISNPDAITYGTLRKAGCATYEQITTLRRSASRSTTHIASFGDYAFESESDPIYSNIALALEAKRNSRASLSCLNTGVPSGRGEAYTAPSATTSTTTTTAAALDYAHSKAANFNPSSSSTSSSCIALEGNKRDSQAEELPLPPPPPELMLSSQPNNNNNNNTATTTTYNKLSNIHRDFLQTLNSKLAIPQQQRMSPRMVKRRSMSVSEHESDEWADSDSGIVAGSACSTTSSSSSSHSQQHNSLQQSLMRLMGHSVNSGPSSLSSSRRESPDPTRKSYTAFTLASYDRESLSQSLNARLKPNTVQQSEVAKAAATVALAFQRKQSVPDASSNFKSNLCTATSNEQESHINPVTDCGKVNTNEPVYQQIAPPPLPPPQPPPKPPQQIYESVQHLQRQANQRRSSQPIMGLKLSSVRQQINQQLQTPPSSENSKTSFLACLDAKLSQQNIYQNPHSPSMQKRASLPTDFIKKDDICMQQSGGRSGVRNHTARSVLSCAIETFETAIANRVHNWLTGRGSVDVVSCRENLMDQIRQGKELKKVSWCNDRSAPKLKI